MTKDLELKKIVKEKYGQIALQTIEQNQTSCCGCGPSDGTYTIMSDDYHALEGYVKDADLGLGCGLPTEYAGINVGDTVLDLGAGAGNDVFIARNITGDTGKVIGIDMTEAMVEKANKNLAKLGFNNVEFILGEIESLPVENNSIDVVISNCVLNLVPNKENAFGEIFRVLKDTGHFCVSDIVIKEELPKNLRSAAEMYAGCVSGALFEDEYLGIIKKTGFKSAEIVKTKQINIPADILKDYLSDDEIKLFMSRPTPIYSITVVGKKQ